MASVADTFQSVNSMTDVRATLKREIGRRRAIQKLAEADHDRRGIPFTGLNMVRADDLAWYRQVVEKQIAAFEESAYDIEPADRIAQRAADREALLTIDRTRARAQAENRGHKLGGWWPVDGRLDETAVCVRCHRAVVLVVTSSPLIDIAREGSALTEGCIVAAGEGN